MSNESDACTLRLERLIPVAPEELFALWTEPAQLVKWWAPEGCTCVVHDFDARPDGHWRISMRGPDGTQEAASGIFRIVERPRRLVFTWTWEDAVGRRGHETEVTASFQPTPGGTRFALVHKHFESRPVRDRHHVGWSSAAQRLENVARSNMPKPEIVGSLRSTYTRAACMVCEEKGIEYALTEVLLGAPELQAIHPLGKMPVLRHGDFSLFESKAIAIYLDLTFPGPRVFPSEPRLIALTEQWVSFSNTVVDVILIRTYLMAYISPRTPDGNPDRRAITEMVPRVREQLGILDRAVARTGYLVGDQFTFADINLLPILDRVRLAPEGADALSATTHLASYYERHSLRPSFKRTTPPPGPPRRAGGTPRSA